ncbi:MAG: type II toxin-antitoxin system VapC family toxin [Candidatus Dormibacteria bacterium]
MTVFVDTSVWYAAADSGDVDNGRAREILAVQEPLLTSDHVLVESWLLLRRRLGGGAAERFLDGILSGVAELEIVTRADLEVARTIGERYADQDFSIVDRTSFAMMHRMGLSRAASFDSDFAIYRVGPRPGRAFEVLS